MKNLKYKFIGFVFALSACGGATSEPFSPTYPGLTGGETSNQHCISFANISLKMLYQEIDYTFTVYLGKQCQANKQIFQSRLPAEAQLAGTWQQFVVVDVGTGGDSRELMLIDPASKKSKVLAYVDEPSFSKQTINYFVETDIEAREKDCTNQAAAFQEWKKFGFEIYLAELYHFDGKSLQSKKMGTTRCVAFQ